MADLPEAQPQAAPIVVNAQYLKDFSFENPNAPQTLIGQQANPQISVSVGIPITERSELNPGTYEVALNLRAEARQGDRVMFVAECSYAGLLTLNGIAPEHHQEVLMIEGGRMLFPFARAILADAIRNGGYPPLFINPIDFVQMFRQFQSQTANQQAATPVSVN